MYCDTVWSFLNFLCLAIFLFFYFSLHRNHGMGDTSIKFEVIPGKNQKSEYVMACGKHTVKGWCKYRSSRKLLLHHFCTLPFEHHEECKVTYNLVIKVVQKHCAVKMTWFYQFFFFFLVGKNKRVGKQLASQKILQLLHPHVKNWGSLLRMYGRESNKMVKKVHGSCVLFCGWRFQTNDSKGKASIYKSNQ